MDVKVVDLPRFAWVGQTQKNTLETRVICGSDVSRARNSIWEGVLCSPEDDPGATSTSLATGVKARPDGVTYFTPSHTLDRVFMVDLEGAFLFSNSLPAILNAGKVSLDDTYPFYPWEFECIDGHSRIIPLAEGRRLTLFYNCLVDVTSEGISIRDYPAPPPFKNFEQYKSALDTGIGQVLSGLAHPENRHFEPLLTSFEGIR